MLKNEALLDVHKDDGAAIPSYTASQRTIERKRKKDDIPLPRPTSFEDISIPQQLTVTNGGGRFLLYDNEDSDYRTIILSSEQIGKQLQHLITAFNINTRKEYFKRARALFNF
ncbi:unnamed protein product [Didymodactylos carnosus]|uniref:Uncharacterized protein n=1 Tax=Didymodactylos carnosus TaxID=1234261 RepID=A0A815I549_9BILA|nr:unnamed protein product [Didymodactylos carnosus]CAF4243144.1 unnamed protein product [Didymodactylos carnosus]